MKLFLRPNKIHIERHPMLFARRQAAKPAPGNEPWRGPVATLLFLIWLLIGLFAAFTISPP